jgi:PKD repeat protein
MMDLATTNVSRLSAGANPGWAQAPPGGFPPTASFTIACTLLTCTFDASRSRGGTIASYSWRFDDGTVQAGIRTPHTYARSGRYSVELLVVDDYGLRGTSTRTFDVTDSPPTASFTAECSGLTCRFDGSGSSDRDGTVLLYAWSFGDGRTATTSDAVVNHSYAPGTYTVRLTVSDNAGATSGAASRAIVVVNSPPVASFGFSCDSLGPVCTFSGSGIDSDGVIVGYAWDFGDGTSGAGSHVTHTYAAAGTYNVRLTVTDNHGATNSRTASVTVASVVLHVGDLDGATDIQKRSWTAFVTIRVHDAEHRPVSARVDGMWSTGQSDYCSGDSSGACTLARSFPTPGSVTFTVQRLSLGLAAYDAARNHDVDGGTNGTSITLMRK